VTIEDLDGLRVALHAPVVDARLRHKSDLKCRNEKQYTKCSTFISIDFVAINKGIYDNGYLKQKGQSNQ